MKFIMTPEIMDQIIFGMENQEKTFILDTDTDHVVPAEETEKESFRYIPIPEWKSSDGFQLMEMFTASMRNPILRERFREALSSGRGVFRSFKNILKERPEIERLWFSFKEKEMRKRVREWYNQLAEVWGLEKLGPEPEDTEELVMSDFSYS
ncbi:MAG: GNAT family N-acetyltransferase, partial [Spirochaetales bacterium]|nr:GNAT family N-acetyltransferase [Spirochaetales bacterium]